MVNYIRTAGLVAKIDSEKGIVIINKKQNKMLETVFIIILSLYKQFVIKDNLKIQRIFSKD